MFRFALRTRTAEKDKESLGASTTILPLSSLATTTSSADISASSSSQHHHFHQAQQNNNNAHVDDNDKKVKSSQSNDNNNSKNNSTNSNSISRMGLFVLILLAVQNCSKNLVVRHVMAQQPQFLTSAAVLSSECLKLACSVLYIVWIQKQSLRSIVYYLRQNVPHALLLCVPASAYNLQSSLEYVALANLNAAMFSVLVQTKLMCTALFAWMVLRKRLKKIQVLSLVLLTTGVMLCNMQNNNHSNGNGSGSKSKATVQQEEDEENGRQTKGILATLGIALSSGFASVYTEKFIKSAPAQQQQQPASSSSSALSPLARDKQLDPELEALRGGYSDDNNKNDDMMSTTTIKTGSSGGSSSLSLSSSSSSSYGGLAYVQVELAVMSIVTIGLYAAIMDWHEIVTYGLFYNFSYGAVVSVCMSALGGLIVASVLKHADSILKGYATALSVILTGILSSMIFGTQLSAIYLLGIINVVTAVILYNGQDLNQYVC